MTSAVNNAPATKKRRAKSLDKVRARAGWLFVVPFLIGFILIYLPIVYESIKSSFCTTHLLKGTTFVGWENYSKALFEYTTSGGETFVTIMMSGRPARPDCCT